MNFSGIILGLSAFLCIGVFHPIVIKCEYHFTYKCWPVFLVCGAACLIVSMWIENVVAASAVGVLGFSFLWSILELFEQQKRVAKGWFPENPKRKKNK
ncbi:MAG: DUF4491 family protein [Clostridia bacterium]|nr:DUF4491 family protein [Clostridia bacterium]